MIDVMVRGFPWYLHPPGIGAGRRPGDRRPCLQPRSETNLLMGGFGLSSNQSSSCSTWAISIVGDGAGAAKSVEGLASNRHDALTERVFRLVRRSRKNISMLILLRVRPATSWKARPCRSLLMTERTCSAGLDNRTMCLRAPFTRQFFSLWTLH
jgi:hypothetical protein